MAFCSRRSNDGMPTKKRSVLVVDDNVRIISFNFESYDSGVDINAHACGM